MRRPETSRARPPVAPPPGPPGPTPTTRASAANCSSSARRPAGRRASERASPLRAAVSRAVGRMQSPAVGRRGPCGPGGRRPRHPWRMQACDDYRPRVQEVLPRLRRRRRRMRQLVFRRKLFEAFDAKSADKLRHEVNRCLAWPEIRNRRHRGRTGDDLGVRLPADAVAGARAAASGQVESPAPDHDAFEAACNAFSDRSARTGPATISRRVPLIRGVRRASRRPPGRRGCGAARGPCGGGTRRRAIHPRGEISPGVFTSGE